MGDEAVKEHMWPIAQAIFTEMDPSTGAKVLFAIIFLLCVLVYKLGFAKKLPLLKAAVVYAVLFFGCSVLTFLGYFLPIAEGLSITALILAVYKVRLHQAKKGRNAA